MWGLPWLILQGPDALFSQRRASRPSARGKHGVSAATRRGLLLSGWLPPSPPPGCTLQKAEEGGGAGVGGWCRWGNRLGRQSPDSGLGLRLQSFRILRADSERFGLLCPGRGHLASCRRCSGPRTDRTVEEVTASN